MTLRLADGELNAEIPDEHRKDEIGATARALNVFKEALIAKRAADEAAARDAQVQIERARRLDGGATTGAQEPHQGYRLHSARWSAGYQHTQSVLERMPWIGEFDPLSGVVLHDPDVVTAAAAE